MTKEPDQFDQMNEEELRLELRKRLYFEIAGWRCCIDHILKPEHPCPICALEKANAEIKQLKSLLNRIHSATEQFYRKKVDKYDNCPYEIILGRYHDIMPSFPKVRKLTAKRKTAMRVRWKEDLTSLADWEAYFRDAAKKRFLIGRNDRGWVANFDFLLREQTIAYMQEGKYDG